MTRTRKWAAGTAGLVLLMIVAGWFLLVAPKKADADTSRANAVAQQATNDGLKTKIAILAAQQADIPKQQATLATIRTAIPDNPALPGLIRTLTGVATTTGTLFGALTNTTPTAVLSASGAAPVAAGAAGSATPTGTLQVSTVGVTIWGSYATIDLFVKQLENSQRALLVSAISLKPNDNADKADYPLQAFITLKVYNVSSSTATLPPAKTTGTTTSTTPNQ
jgi:type IV pilus assembly protein PilO